MYPCVLTVITLRRWPGACGVLNFPCMHAHACSPLWFQPSSLWGDSVGHFLCECVLCPQRDGAQRFLVHSAQFSTAVLPRIHLPSEVSSLQGWNVRVRCVVYVSPAVAVLIPWFWQ